MPLWGSPPQPKGLARHRILSPTAAVKVSALCLGGISIGSSWSSAFGKNEDPFKLMDAFFSIGGNFIDTSNVYNDGDSEKLIGEWMERRGNRDQMVIATKYTAGYRAKNVEKEPMQSNFTGNSAKSMHVSFRDSLKNLRTDYVDIFYVHWWDFATSVEEVMRHLHALVMAGKVLYLGVSDTPAWVVVKANAYANQHGLTPFSIYQGKWNAAFRDLEAEIIPMCEDQGMAIVSWAALGGGNLLSKAQREQNEKDPDARKSRKLSDQDIKVSEVLEKIADAKKTTFQAVALAYLFHQSTYVFPIVGVNTVEHVEAMPEALRVKLSDEEIAAVHEASEFRPLFPVEFLYNFDGDQPYNTRLTPAHNKQYQGSAWIDAPPKQLPYQPRDD